MTDVITAFVTSTVAIVVSLFALAWNVSNYFLTRLTSARRNLEKMESGYSTIQDSIALVAFHRKMDPNGLRLFMETPYCANMPITVSKGSLESRQKFFLDIKSAVHKVEGFWDVFLRAAAHGNLPSTVIEVSKNGDIVNMSDEWRWRSERFVQVFGLLALSNNIFIWGRDRPPRLDKRYERITKFLTGKPQHAVAYVENYFQQQLIYARAEYQA